MDWNRVEGNWKQVKGKVKEKWGKLTDDDLATINGTRSARRQDPGALRLRQGSGQEGRRRLVWVAILVVLVPFDWARRFAGPFFGLDLPRERPDERHF